MPDSATPITTFTTTSAIADVIGEGWNIVLYNSAGIDNPTANHSRIKAINGTTVSLYNETTAVNWSNYTHAWIYRDRVLNFNKDVNITGLNVIDDLLFWTDGNSEPKKINITRSKKGTNIYGWNHTQLYVTNENGDLEIAGALELGEDNSNSDVREEHVTVLRPAPKTPPTIEVNSRDLAELTFTTTDASWIDSNTS